MCEWWFLGVYSLNTESEPRKKIYKAYYGFVNGVSANSIRWHLRFFYWRKENSISLKTVWLLSTLFDIQYLCPNNGRNLRSVNILLLSSPSHNSDFVNSSFFVQAVLLWNMLPLEITKSKDIKNESTWTPSK